KFMTNLPDRKKTVKSDKFGQTGKTETRFLQAQVHHSAKRDHLRAPASKHNKNCQKITSKCSSSSLSSSSPTPLPLVHQKIPPISLNCIVLNGQQTTTTQHQ